MRHLFILITVLSIVSCKNDSPKTYNQFNPEITEILPEQTVINFLKWYRDNEERVNKIRYIRGGLKDTTTFYRIDFKAADKYFSELKKSNFLSDVFINDLRDYFKKGDENFVNRPQNDGPPDYFDFDLIMKSQDYMDVWTNLDKATVIEKEVSNNTAYIELLFNGNYKTKYCLTKTNGKWLIDNIY